MQEYRVGVVVSALLLFCIVAIADSYKRGMIAVVSGQYSCELEERADKATKWVCERVK